MHVNNFEELKKSLDETRKKFHLITQNIPTLKENVELFFGTILVISRVAINNDDEKFALEVLFTAFRRTISSYVLLESGLPKEARMILRNSLELTLIAIDIIYNKESLNQWKNTINDDLTTDNSDWYFSKKEIQKRITENLKNHYPELEQALADSACKEWVNISNTELHAHSYAQIKDLIDENGNFQLFGLKNTESYQKDFKVFQQFIFNITTILLGIPKYFDRLKKRNDLRESMESLIQKYNKLKS